MLDVADYNITLYEALALGTPVVVSRDQEVDAAIAGCELRFPTGLSTNEIAMQMKQVLGLAKAPRLTAEQETFLRGMTWENYAHRILAEMSHAH